MRNFWVIVRSAFMEPPNSASRPAVIGVANQSLRPQYRRSSAREWRGAGHADPHELYRANRDACRGAGRLVARITRWRAELHSQPRHRILCPNTVKRSLFLRCLVVRLSLVDPSIGRSLSEHSI